MKKLFLVLLMLAFTTSLAYAGWINGYYRKDGTYVPPYERSDPNDTKSDNFGPSQSDIERLNPSLRDYDKDGISNQFDNDDDNDGRLDDFDRRQYSPKRW